MTVVQGWIGDRDFSSLREKEDLGLGSALKETLVQSIAINSKAFIYQNEDKIEFIGSKTECAMLIFISNILEEDYKPIREATEIIKIQDFTSDTKMMSTWIKSGAGVRRLVKGAPEMVLNQCTKMMNNNGDVIDMTDETRQQLFDLVDGMAKKALRTMLLAYIDGEVESDTYAVDLTFVSVFGIEDPLRVEVPFAVDNCKNAGITVRMITGDNIQTAKKIAEQCGILTPTGIAMEGSVFERLSDDQIDDVLPRLQVLARSAPRHKHKLVKRLIQNGELVAVTGDGINDVLALSEANIGIAMGVTGTDVAKEASDIIVLDDNFASITKTVLWGRTVYENIRRFLQFQLTIILTTLVVTVIAAVSGYGIPLKAIQLLWVNLFMDSIAALSSSIDKASPKLLDQAPYGAHGSILTLKMKRNVMSQTIFMCVILFVILYAGPYIWSYENGSTLLAPNAHYTMVFNTFALMHILNLLNCRRIHDEMSLFETIQHSWALLVSQAVAIIAQVIIVQYGDAVFFCMPLNWYQWLSCVFLALMVFPIRYISMYAFPVKGKK
eukprot:TRINITY_DN6439_c0_g1_i1.p1 TRINITY_DN6439_c0_g1~~TRINITY_DN6439_c0_g1_i1.p1  ORF type:complete len:602 (+),score=119.50 TRINITY_DN6439_c0_g1_i1:151-1806(+)